MSHSKDNTQDKRTVAIVTTGGTIAMRDDAGQGGPVPALDAADLRAALPDLPVALRAVEVCKLPSSHFTLETLWQIRQAVADLAADPVVDGVVVAHGTDVIEETALLLDLTVPGETPVVLTGAMRAASDPGYEGIANLYAALRVAACPKARGLGALLVFGDEVHAARQVTKMHTLSPSTFQSPGWGPIGRVEGERVLLRRRDRRAVLDCPGLEPRVALIKLGVGLEPDLLHDAVKRGARGVVIEALGGARVPPWWLPEIERAVQQQVVVVIASRVPGGRAWDRYGYTGARASTEALGCLFSEDLNGPKARVQLMVVLGAAADAAEAARLWQSLL